MEKFYRESPEIAKITRKLRVQLGTATFKDKLIYYSPRYWWVPLLLVWWWLK